MARRWTAIGMLALAGLLAVACEDSSSSTTGYDYPEARPIWIVEWDPSTTIFAREDEDLERDRKVGPILVIPLYMYYQHEGTTDSFAIAHPFVYTQGEDLESQLAALGQRENLRRLIIWVPGYFPGAIGRTPAWVPVIDGQQVMVLELQQCEGQEAAQINAAMKDLLTGGDFVTEQVVSWSTHPPYSNEPTRVNEPYDIRHTVRSVEFTARYYRSGTARPIALWAFGPGMQIKNRLTQTEKQTVAAFAAEAGSGDARKASVEAATEDGTETGPGAGSSNPVDSPR